MSEKARMKRFSFLLIYTYITTDVTPLNGMVEVYETYVGGKNKNRPKIKECQTHKKANEPRTLR